MAGWVNFAVKCVLAVLAIYLAATFFYGADLKRMSDMMTNADGQLKRLDKQAQMLTALSTNQNPQMLYYMAQEDMGRKDIKAAVAKLSTAMQISEMTAQQCRAQLNQIMAQVKP